MSTVSSTGDMTGQPQVPPRKRGCLFLIGRVLKWFVIVLVLLVVLGLVYQAAAVELDKRAYAPRDQLYSVNGHMMHMVCTGERSAGSPAVILHAGASAASLWWYWVQDQLSQHTQVCAFDRPGMGYSEPVDGPRDPQTINAELHTLLQQADVPAPYVVVGHSYGGILTRVFAAQYPQDVSGIVLVDSQLVTPKHFASQAEVDQNRAYWDVVRLLTSGMTRVGLTRLVVNGDFRSVGYPADLVPELTGLQARNQVVNAYYAENGPAFPALQEASAAAENLGDLPMIVLWARLTYDVNHANPTLGAPTDELSTYSANSLIRIIDGANHGSIIGNKQYAAQVTDAVLKVINAAQTGAPLL
ncbi:MAG: alpha/beta hydrolase [Anaerolineae bacterium]|nr:alpha/beta hydrolase [Anaerolineae bacterium]